MKSKSTPSSAPFLPITLFVPKVTIINSWAYFLPKLFYIFLNILTQIHIPKLRQVYR